jgi:WhiB family redox-sensing transcriptional regulator
MTVPVSFVGAMRRAGYSRDRVAHTNEALLLEPPAWFIDALCAQVDNDIFFPDKGESTRAPKSICAACPVRNECLEYALTHNERYGVWGGLSERERRQLRRRAS